MDIDNDDALEKALAMELYSLVEATGDQFLQEIQDNVQSIVYDPYDPTVYQRTNDFLESWSKKDLFEGKKRTFGFQIFSDPDLISYNGDAYQHGSPTVDRSKDMADIIMTGTRWDWSSKKDPDNEWWKEPRDFWTPTLQLLGGDMLSKIMRDNLKLKTGWDVLVVYDDGGTDDVPTV